MISIQQALEYIHQQPVTLSASRRSLADARGYALAETILAPFDVPAFDNSSVDGYALAGEADQYLIVGEVAAGDTDEKKLDDGQAMRIFTGARLPLRANRIAMQEYAEVEGNRLRLLRPAHAGQFIRPKAGELKQGSTAFEPGAFITPAAMGFLASLGYNEVKVYNKPRVAAMATGNELLRPGETWVEGKIYESSRTAVGAALHDKGFELASSVLMADDRAVIAGSAKRMLKESDVLLVTGGISVGDYDFVKPALEDIGVKEIFHKVNQKPGKPLYFGVREGKFVFGLPGNPASALTCFYVYVLPLLHRMSGMPATGLMRMRVPLEHDYVFDSDRPSFLKAHIKDGKVFVLDGQLSSMIHSFARSNALVFMDAPGSFAAGDPVECLLL